jgi:hypothetical protein
MISLTGWSVFALFITISFLSNSLEFLFGLIQIIQLYAHSIMSNK